MLNAVSQQIMKVQALCSVTQVLDIALLCDSHTTFQKRFLFISIRKA